MRLSVGPLVRPLCYSTATPPRHLTPPLRHPGFSSQIEDTKDLIATLTSLMPKAVATGGESTEDKIYAQAKMLKKTVSHTGVCSSCFVNVHESFMNRSWNVHGTFTKRADPV